MQRINFQPISKIERGDGQTLLIHSVFPTIQGEGPNVGMPAVFLRLGGCNLQCPGCDTEYTSGAANEPIESILTRIRMAFGDRRGSRLVVITGGEPLRQNLYKLIHQLHESYIQVQIETNGTAEIQESLLWHHHLKGSGLAPQIVVSPKAGKVHLSLFPYIAAYKYVLDAHHVDPDDGLPESVLGMPGRPARPHEGYDGPVYVQPADEPACGDWGGEGANTENLKAAIDSAMKYGYRLCLQTHKITGLE